MTHRQKRTLTLTPGARFLSLLPPTVCRHIGFNLHLSNGVDPPVPSRPQISYEHTFLKHGTVSAGRKPGTVSTGRTLVRFRLVKGRTPYTFVFTQEADRPDRSTSMPKVVVGGPQVLKVFSWIFIYISQKYGPGPQKIGETRLDNAIYD